MEPRKTTCAIIFLAIGLTTAFKVDFTRTINFSSDEGRVAVYDAAMPEWLTAVLADFFEDGTRWSYEYPDSLAGVSPREDNNVPWVSPISPLFFMKSKPWIVFNLLAKDFTGRDDMVAYQATATMITRGDTPAVVPAAKNEDVYFRIFMSSQNQTLQQMVFFDENNEIVQSVKAKFNRIVAWNATLAYQYKPPVFDDYNRDYSIVVKLTPEAEKVQEEMKYITKFREDEEKEKQAPFPFKNASGEPLTNEFFDAHCKRKFYDYRGGVISFFDDVFTENELSILRRYLLKHTSGYSNAAYTTDESSDADNVNWIVMLDPEVVYGTRILEVVLGLAKYLSGEDGWHPYDVSLNMIQNSFHTRIHEDCEDYEFEYTFLLYLNQNWTEDMYGETIFLNQVKEMIKDDNDTVIQDKEYETIVSVRPKYGRIAMFRNNIPHSARPPSPDFKGTRYSFAVKVSRNKLIALTKVLRELLEFKQDDQGEGAALYETVANMASTWNFTMSADELHGNITKYRIEKAGLTAETFDARVKGILRKAYFGNDQPSL